MDKDPLFDCVRYEMLYMELALHFFKIENGDLRSVPKIQLPQNFGDIVFDRTFT